MHNADPNELAKFSDLAHRWWDPMSEFKPLHAINPLRLEWIQSFIRLDGLKVLDIGCGGGILSESMAAAGALVTGIDLSEKALSVAKLHLYESGHKINYQLISAEEHASQNLGLYDVVTCMELLEHVPNPQSTITACSQLVRPGGFVFFSTLNRNLKSYYMAVIGAEYILRLLPKGTHDYTKFIRPSELCRWTNQQSLMTQELKGMAYNPFSDTHKLTDNTSVNYLLATRK